MDLNKEELFYQDNKLFEFESYVKNVIAYDDKFGIVLDKTGFFPEAGGQYADSGTLNGVEVMDVQVTSNGIEHFTKHEFSVGDKVLGVLDKEERLNKERNHTGEHIVSGIVFKLFGYDNVGFHMGANGMDVDFNGAFTDEDIREIERQANEVVRQNVNVKCYFPTADELANINYRSKLELETPRIVEIQGYDYCACCAPHVSQTGEIGLIKIVDSCKNRGNTRLTLLCAKDAFEYVLKVTTDAQKAGALLSTKPYSVSTALQKHLNVTLEQQKEISTLRHSLTMVTVNSLTKTDNYIVVFCESFMTKDVVNAGVELAKGVCVFNEVEGGYSYMLASIKEDIRGLSQEMNKKFNGKGGGKPNACQGRITADRLQIEKFFEEKNKE